MIYSICQTLFPSSLINDVFIDEFTFIHWELQANLFPSSATARSSLTT